jgi:hypothetical protein
MEPQSFDQLARFVATSGSRRRLLAGALGGALGSLRARTATADEGGTIIADASGGDLNRATATDPTTTGNDRDKGKGTRDRNPCQPDSERDRCEGRCDIVVNDGCGGELKCTCDDDKVCARDDAVCCRPERLCDGKRVCCKGEDICGPGDTCCPPERLCIPSDVCCSASKVCAPGGGVCCLPERVCTVGGVRDACCSFGKACMAGVCQ